ncbi:MAG: hypothetical protein ACPLSY_04780 [Moorellaceae bacterium]
MRILMNAPQEKLAYYTRVSGVPFAPLQNEVGDDAVALVVRGETFTSDLAEAVALGVPVVVVAGTEAGGPGRGYAAEALAAGVPASCVLVKKGQKVVALDGREYGPAAARGIGLGAVLKAATYALENRLIPEPLIWEEEGEEGTPSGRMVASENGVSRGPGTAETGQPGVPAETPPPARGEVGPAPASVGAGPPATTAASKREVVKPAAPPAQAAGSLENVMDLSSGVIAVFRSVPGATSGPLARDLAAVLGAAHLEVSPRAGSYAFYGRDFASALRSGRYLYCDGEAVRRGSGYTGGGRLVVEVDPSVPDPHAIDAVYRRAGAVVHVVKASEQEASLRAVRAWVASGWRLDAVVPDDAAAFGGIEGEFGGLACRDAGEVVRKIGLADSRNN